MTEPMKLQIDQFKELMQKHIFNLTENELKSLAFIFNIEITAFKKNDWEIECKMKHELTSVILDCSKNSNISMGKRRNKMYSWGGVFTFNDALRTFRTFFCRSLTLTIVSPEKLKIYSETEWVQMFQLAFEYITSKSSSSNLKSQ